MPAVCDLVLPCRDEGPALRGLLATVPAGLAVIVVDNGSTDDTAAVAHTPPAAGGLDGASRRQRMAPASGDRVVAELILQRHVRRCGDMGLLVGGTPVGLGELPSHVENRHRVTGRQQRGQFRCGDQHLATTSSVHV